MGRRAENVHLPLLCQQAKQHKNTHSLGHKEFTPLFVSENTPQQTKTLNRKVVYHSDGILPKYTEDSSAVFEVVSLIFFLVSSDFVLWTSVFMRALLHKDSYHLGDWKPCLTDRQDNKTKEERRYIPFSGQALHCHGASVYSVRVCLSSENSLFFYVLSPYFLQYRDLGCLASEPAKHTDSPVWRCSPLWPLMTTEKADHWPVKGANHFRRKQFKFSSKCKKKKSAINFLWYFSPLLFFTWYFSTPPQNTSGPGRNYMLSAMLFFFPSMSVEFR